MTKNEAQDIAYDMMLEVVNSISSDAISERLLSLIEDESSPEFLEAHDLVQSAIHGSKISVVWG